MSLRVSLQESTPLISSRGSGLPVPYNQPYKKPPWFKRPRFYTSLLRRGFAEFLGTALFVFVAVSASSSVSEDELYNRSITASSATVVALATGLAYTGLMAANGHVSGGHMNPSVTVGVFIAGGINIGVAILYVFMQLAGAIAGAACVLAYDTSYNSRNSSNHSVHVDTTVDYGLTTLHGGISPLQGIAVETVLTLMLVIVYIHTTREGGERSSVSEKGSGSKSTAVRSAIAPLACGFTLAAGIMSSYSVTGGSFNPARSLGPATVGSDPQRWEYHYVYWAGPLLGALLAGVFYRLVLSSTPLLPMTENDSRKSQTGSRIH